MVMMMMMTAAETQVFQQMLELFFIF